MVGGDRLVIAYQAVGIPRSKFNLWWPLLGGSTLAGWLPLFGCNRLELMKICQGVDS